MKEKKLLSLVLYEKSMYKEIDHEGNRQGTYKYCFDQILGKT